MRLMEKIFGGEKRANPTPSIGASSPDLADFWGIKNYLGHFVSPESGAAIAVAHRCIQAIAEPLSQMPLKLYRRAGNGGREAAEDHPLYGVLQDQANPLMTAFAAREMLTVACLVHGNAYAKIVHNGRGQVTAINPLMPGTVTVEKLKSGRLRYKYYNPDGGAEVLLQEEVLHLRYRTRDGIIGISPIQHCRETFSLAIDQREQAHEQTMRSFKPDGAFVFPAVITGTTAQSYLDSFTKKVRDWYKRKEPMVLDGGVKYEPFNFNAKDSEFLESRKLTNLDICRIYGVPPSAAGITDNSTYSNIGEESRALVVRCLAPWAKRIEQWLNMALLTPESRKSLFIEHDLAGLLRGDLGARYTAYKTGREGGWLSVNEIRGWENLPSIDGGDEYLSPLNMTPAGGRPEGTGDATA